MTENENKSDGISPHPRSQTHPNNPRRITHPNLPKGQPILTFPKGKEQVSLDIAISPHLASPIGEGQLLLLLINH